MNENNTLYPLFSTPILSIKNAYKISPKEYKFILNQKKTKILSDGTEYRREAKDKGIWTYNFRSDNAYILDTPGLKKLKKVFQKHVEDYFYGVLHVKKNQLFYITQSWINYNPPGASHHFHHHPNSILSGVFYFHEKNTPLIFEKVGLFPGFEFICDKYDVVNSISYWMEASQHKLVLFPSSLRHGVARNESDKMRISLSFNTFAKGTIGEYTELTELAK